MIIKENRKIFLICDGCNKKVYIREITGIDLLKLKVKFPEGWSGYDEFNQTRLIFCQDKQCQDKLNILCKKVDNDKRLVQQNWTGTV